MSESAFDVFCPNCNILVEAKVIAQGSGGFSSDADGFIDKIATEYHGDQYFVCLCRRCSQPFLIKRSLYGVPAEFESITDEIVLYPTESKLIEEGLPEAVKTAYDHGGKIIQCISVRTMCSHVQEVFGGSLQKL